MGTGSGRGPGWAERTFGESAGEPARLIPVGLVRAHDRARSAHEGVRTQTLEAYDHGLYAAQFEELPLPASGGLPGGVLRDDPPAPHPDRHFDVDPGVFDATPARSAAVRGPWPRELSGRLPRHVRGGA